MIAELQTLAAAAVMQRVTLLLNHVIAAEPAAVQRLLPHAGRRLALRFEGWPAWLPPLPGAAFSITPAGLLEWCEPAAATDTSPADLSVAVDAGNPALAMAQAIAGERPRIDISGDAALAADVNWLFDHLRWDVEDDLARVVGAGPAHQITRLGQGIGAALRDAVRTLTRRGRPAGDGTSSPQ